MRKSFVLLLFLLAFSGVALAQPVLTDADYKKIQTDILVTNQAEFAADVAAKNYGVITQKYNMALAPPFYIYKYKVQRLDILFGTSSEGTTFKNTDVGFPLAQIPRWTELFSRGDDATAPGLLTVRDALLTIFAGTGDAQLNRVHIGHMSRKETSRAEKLFVTSGAGTKADPGVASWQGVLTQGDIEYALRMP
jgi:hypothetical protein